MHDRDDEEPTIKNESLERLETVSYHLTELYKLLSKDRDSWAMTGGDLGQAIQELQKHIKSFSAIDETFRKQLAKFIREETKQAAVTVTESMKQSVKEATTAEVDTITRKLNAAVDLADSRLVAYQQAHAEANKAMHHVNTWFVPLIMILGTIFGSMVGGFTVDWVHDHPSFLRSAPVVQDVSRAKK